MNELEKRIERSQKALSVLANPAEAHHEITALRTENRDLQNWLNDARAQAEACQKRMCELLTVCQAVQRDLLLRAEPDFDGSGVKVVNLSAGFWDELNRVIGKYDQTAALSFDAMVLRKQAEAVENFAACLSGTLNQRLAQSKVADLRDQASELENPGE